MITACLIHEDPSAVCVTPLCVCQSQAEELGIDKGSLANMSKVELAMRSDDPALLTAWQKKKTRAGGRVSVTIATQW